MEEESKVSKVKRLRNAFGCSLKYAHDTLQAADWNYEEAHKRLSLSDGGLRDRPSIGAQAHAARKVEYVRTHAPAIAAAFLRAGGTLDWVRVATFSVDTASAIFEAAERIKA